MRWINKLNETNTVAETLAAASRRRFLQGGLSAGVSAGAASLLRVPKAGLTLWQTMRSALGPDVASAGNPVDLGRYFLILRTQGNCGMDVTLGLDPWTDPRRPPATDMFIEYQDGDVIRKGGIALGPSAAGLAPHAAQCAVVNGILVSENDNGHDGAMTYMSTGDGTGKAPDLAGELAVSSPSGAYGVLVTDGIHTADRVFRSSRFGDVTVALDAPDLADAIARLLPKDRRTPLQGAQEEVVDADAVTKALLETLRGWRAAGQPMDDERVAAAAFLSGACRQAQLSMEASGNLDTHANHVGNHLSAQKSIWDRVASIFDLFKSLPYGISGDSLFDRTTFLVYNEFSRTPALDAAGGKNHNPLTNSVLLAGHAVRGGLTFGSSRLIGAQASVTGRSYHMGAPLDWSTGRPAASREGAEFIFPENLIRSCAQLHGADLRLFHSVAAGVKPIPGMFARAGGH